MDYKLAALKLFCVQLKSASIAPEHNAFSLGGAILFQRAWLQGVLVSDGDRLLLDDGTGVIQLNLSNEFRSRHLEAGMYVMVVGGYAARADDIPMIKYWRMINLAGFLTSVANLVSKLRNLIAGSDIKECLSLVHKLVDLSSFPEREPMWYLEVMEAFNILYKPLLEA